ncbi:hypothetical protein VNO80_06824 [Phaseolus coccineus]|uniref:Uncharacterized protein n=1 Tax=Phaseolus coccineus TaxID=3886 RepID=A0AAN9NMC0_PHACN
MCLVTPLSSLLQLHVLQERSENLRRNSKRCLQNNTDGASSGRVHSNAQIRQQEHQKLSLNLSVRLVEYLYTWATPLSQMAKRGGMQLASDRTRVTPGGLLHVSLCG